MQVILLEKVEKLGHMGDVVNVKPGYARNFLLPREKALRATKANIAFFETQKKVIEADSQKRKVEAEKLAAKIEGVHVSVIRSASEAGSLYGSVSARDISDALAEKGFEVNRSTVVIDRAYKTLGLYPVKINLHPEVKATITLNIARSADEAKIQEERGEALIFTPADEKAAIAAEKAEALAAKLKKQEARKAKSSKKSEDEGEVAAEEVKTEE